MNGIIQAASKNMTVVNLNQTEVVDFDICAEKSGEDKSGENKLVRYYSELGKDEDFPVFRAVMGAGGAKNFEIQTGIDGLDSSIPEVCGVILHAHDVNVYFDKDAPGEPPLCSSNDGIEGFNRLTGEKCLCADCPRNRKADRNTPKECRNKKRLYILTEDTPMPMVMDLPPTSLTPWKKYLKTIKMYGYLQYYEVVSVFRLDNTRKNAEGKKYSVVTIKMEAKLSEESAEKIRQIKQIFKPDVITIHDWTDITEETNETEEAE